MDEKMGFRHHGAACRARQALAHRDGADVAMTPHGKPAGRAARAGAQHGHDCARSLFFITMLASDGERVGAPALVGFLKKNFMLAGFHVHRRQRRHCCLYFHYLAELL